MVADRAGRAGIRCAASVQHGEQGARAIVDFTAAAAAAGVASPSHFSDTFHAMCGLSPARLPATGTQLVVDPAWATRCGAHPRAS